ncbi:hypothetical protein SISNIDRAFT_551469, partial [Sistotremastrum niveocremeum HHB9708]
MLPHDEPLSEPHIVTIDADPPTTDLPAAGPDESDPHHKPRKSRPKPSTDRPKGQTILPMPRVQKMIKVDSELAPASKDAVFLVSAATEEFLRRLVQQGHKQAMNERRLTIYQRDMAQATRLHPEMAEMIPAPIPLVTALHLRAAKEKEDPLAPDSNLSQPGGVSMASASTSSTVQPASTVGPSSTKSKPRQRLPSGRLAARANGSASASTSASAAAPMAPPPLAQAKAGQGILALTPPQHVHQPQKAPTASRARHPDIVSRGWMPPPMMPPPSTTPNGHAHAHGHPVHPYHPSLPLPPPPGPGGQGSGQAGLHYPPRGSYYPMPYASAPPPAPSSSTSGSRSRNYYPSESFPPLPKIHPPSHPHSHSQSQPKSGGADRASSKSPVSPISDDGD